MQLRYDTGTLSASQSIELETHETLPGNTAPIIFSIPRELARQQADIDRLISAMATAIDEGRNAEHVADAYQMSDACRQSVKAVATTKPEVEDDNADYSHRTGVPQVCRIGGRATRAEYWWWLLFTFIGSIVFIVIDSLIGFPRVWEYGLLETLFWLATLLPSITVVTRRLHDIGKTGWWQVPWYGILFVAWLATGMFIVALVITYGVTNASGEWSFDDADIQWESAIEVFAFLLAAIMLIAALAITLAVIVWAIIWMARQGESGQNRFGPDPRA